MREARRWHAAVGLGMLCLATPIWLSAQIDPEKRRVFQFGYDLPLRGYGPMSAYAYYYHNQPAFLRTNLTVRLALAPVYLDSELGVASALGPQTDLGIGLAGGGFADSYSEIRQGNFEDTESFTGHAAETSLSLYHRLNPDATVPLTATIRGSIHRPFYERDDATASGFELPPEGVEFRLRTGLRLGGREPYLFPRMAGEISLWQESHYRSAHGDYGFGGDRRREGQTHFFWGRAMAAYTFPESQHFVELSLTGGGSLQADRMSCFRLGGNLPLVSEFPLTVPGYMGQEISAESFGLAVARYVLPLDPGKRWALLMFGSAATVQYLPGFEQAHTFHPGLGGGLVYRSPSGTWQLGAGYAYGFHALREGEPGAHSLSVVAQYDLEAQQRAGITPFWHPWLTPDAWRGVFRIFGAR